MIFLALLFIGFGLVYIGKALSELTDLVYFMSTSTDDDDDPGPPQKLHSLDDILGDMSNDIERGDTNI
jgi:hypothetical protein